MSNNLKKGKIKSVWDLSTNQRVFGWDAEVRSSTLQHFTASAQPQHSTRGQQTDRGRTTRVRSAVGSRRLSREPSGGRVTRAFLPGVGLWKVRKGIFIVMFGSFIYCFSESNYVLVIYSLLQRE